MTPVNDVSIEVSNTCFFKCKMCTFWQNTKNNNIDISYYKSFFQDLTKFNGRNTTVSFTGGEPLLYPHVYELLSIAKKLGFRTNILTNGWLLDKNNIKKICDASPDLISLSLDGSTATLHDEIRGVKGSYKKILESCKLIKEEFNKQRKSVQVRITTVVSKLNIHNIENIVELITRNKYIDTMHCQAVTDVNPDPNNQNNFDKYLKLWPRNNKQILDAYTNLIYIKRKNNLFSTSEKRLKMQYHYFMHPDLRIKNLVCHAYKDLIIDVEGNVTLCIPMKLILGNIKNKSIDQMLNSDKFLRYKKKNKKLSKKLSRVIM